MGSLLFYQKSPTSGLTPEWPALPSGYSGGEPAVPSPGNSEQPLVMREDSLVSGWHLGLVIPLEEKMLVLN